MINKLKSLFSASSSRKEIVDQPLISNNLKEDEFGDDSDTDYADVTIRIELGSITNITADAIVNSTNKMLMAGGGVDGAIHKAAGPLLQQELRRFGHCNEGAVVITPGFNLSATHVIHTVTPVYLRFSPSSVELLRCCYRAIFAAATELECGTVAIPAIGAGVHDFPIDVSARIAKEEYRKFFSEFKSSVTEIIFVLHSEEDYRRYQEEFECFPVAYGNLEKLGSSQVFFTEKKVVLDGDFVVTLIPSSTNVASWFVDVRESERVNTRVQAGIRSLTNDGDFSVGLVLACDGLESLSMRGNGKIVLAGAMSRLALDIDGYIDVESLALVDDLSVKTDGVGTLNFAVASTFVIDSDGEFDCFATVTDSATVRRSGFGDILIAGGPGYQEVVDTGVGRIEIEPPTM